jgi:hypothetical protein
MPVVHLAQTVHPSSAKINTISNTDQNELPLDTRNLGVPTGVPKMISTPVVHSAQTMHLSCAEIKTISKRTEMSST